MMGIYVLISLISFYEKNYARSVYFLGAAIITLGVLMM